MVMMCPKGCGEFQDGTIFCPECGTTVDKVVESKKNRKSNLDKKIFDFLKKEFDEVYAVGYNVKSIDIFDERNSNKTADEKFTRWLKESTSLVLKDKNAFLSIEMMPSISTSPITVTGNVLVHSIADSIFVKFSGRRKDVEYIIGDKEFSRYLLIVIPDPDESVYSNKDTQMKIIEQRIKEMKFLENSSLKNFKICLLSEFEDAIKDLI